MERDAYTGPWDGTCAQEQTLRLLGARTSPGMGAVLSSLRVERDLSVHKELLSLWR